MERTKPFLGANGLFGFKSSKTNNAWLAAIINSSNDAIISKALDGNITSWNPAAERMFGFTEAEMLHASVRRLIPARLQEEEDDILNTIRAGQTVEPFNTLRLRKDGQEIPINVTVSPIFDGDGEVIGASKIAQDISDVLAARKTVLESESRFHTMADNVSQLAWMADETGYIFWYNKRWFEYTGTTLEDMQGWGWTRVHHPDHVDRVVKRIEHSWATGEVWEDTFPLLGADGEYRWFLSRAMPVHDENGKLIRWFGTNTDITEERERQEENHFLMREVFHRSKNMLALVQGIARQTIGKEDRYFLELFNARILALSLSQNLFLQSGWRGTSIEDLIREQLAHLEDALDDRVRLTGPDFRINPNAAQTLGMALHELATNAVKYGALANDTGTIKIEWSLLPVTDSTQERLWISWTESGGPPVVAPERKGFGTTVLSKMCRSAFGAEIELTYDPNGLRWQLTGGPGRGLEVNEDDEDGA